MKHTAIIGYPIGHSMSPVLHNTAYNMLGLDAEMIKHEDMSVERLVEIIKTTPIELTAVTAPHKQEIMEYMDEIDETATAIGAVNTVVNRDGKLHGYNTDIVGIEKTLEGISLKDKAVLLIGAGGAARPVAHLVNREGGKLLCQNRTPEKAKELIEAFGGRRTTASEILPENIDIIINTTPVGMHPHVEGSPLDASFLRSEHIVFDMLYNPLETKLLADAREAGATTINGMPMFIAQGLEQIRLWSDRTVDDTAPLEEAIIRELQK